MKEEIRKKYLEARKVLCSEYVALAINKINNKLSDYLSYYPGMTIGLYYPMSSEINILSTATQCINKDFIIVAPVIIENTSHMEFALWRHDTVFMKNQFGFLEPNKAIVKIPDILVVPSIVCDSLGNRIGYGKGFYDRYIACWRHKIKSVVGVCYDDLIYPGILPTNHHDQKIDVLISEHKILNIS